VHDDARRWDERYATAARVEARPPEVIERWPELISLVPEAGRCLDVASGPGAVTLWSARRGLEVTALDASAVAIGLLRNAAAAAGVAGKVDALVFDLDEGLPDDLGGFDVIVCQRFRDPALYAPMIDRLGAGGIAIVTVLSTVGSTHPGPFHAPAGELSETFGADERCEILQWWEGEGVAHVVVRRRGGSQAPSSNTSRRAS
jgi:SAM-dependent methyltransferase